jgi:hypothetical protein
MSVISSSFKDLLDFCQNFLRQLLSVVKVAHAGLLRVMAELAPAVEVGGGGKRASALGTTVVTVTDESAVRLDDVTRHLAVALEDVTCPAPDRRLEEPSQLGAPGAGHHLEQREALSFQRERRVVSHQPERHAPNV